MFPQKILLTTKICMYMYTCIMQYNSNPEIISLVKKNLFVVVLAWKSLFSGNTVMGRIVKNIARIIGILSIIYMTPHAGLDQNHD